MDCAQKSLNSLVCDFEKHTECYYCIIRAVHGGQAEASPYSMGI
jgi:hypothetical protein